MMSGHKQKNVFSKNTAVGLVSFRLTTLGDFWRQNSFTSFKIITIFWLFASGLSEIFVDILLNITSPTLEEWFKLKGI